MAKKVKREDLGMGISALFNKKVDTSSEENLTKELSHSVAEIPLAQVRVNPEQPRTDFDAEALESLAQSIRTFGLIQPITVRYLAPDEYQLISGERRMRASKMAGLKKVPAYVRLADDKQEMLEMALVENTHREDLNAIEIAMAYQRLVEECDLSHEKLSQRVGKRRSTITNYLRLLELSAEVQQAVRDKQVSTGHAKAIAGVGDRKKQAELLRHVIEKDLTVRATESLARNLGKKKKESPKKSLDLSPEYEKVQQDLRAFFGSGKVELKLKGEGKGQIIIPFQSVKELNQMLDRLEDE